MHLLHYLNLFQIRVLETDFPLIVPPVKFIVVDLSVELPYAYIPYVASVLDSA